MTAELDRDTIDRYLPFIRMRVRQLELDPRLRGRLGESDLVNDAVVKALAGWDGRRGQTEGELLRWLQAVVHDACVDAIRFHTAGKRDVARERVLEAARNESSASIREYLAAATSSPSKHAMRHEALLRLAGAVDALPGDQRDVVILHYLLGAKVADIADRVGKPEGTVGYLLFVARRTLKDQLRALE
jgi:RNA polymerase sigma-70 factor (ECF subfamily)